MSNTVDFSSILSKKASDVEAPASFPAGSYNLLVLGYQFGTSAKKQTPYVEFEFGVQAPGEDVDQEEYAKIKNPAEKHLKTQFYLSEEALFRLNDFLKSCGLDVDSERTLGEILPEVVNTSVIGIIKKEMAQDGSGREFTRLNSFLAQ